MKTKEDFEYEEKIEIEKRAIAERFEREQLRGHHRPGKVRNPMTHLTPKKKKRKK